MKKIDIEQEKMQRANEIMDALTDIKDEFIVEAAELHESAAVPAFTVIEGAKAEASTWNGAGKTAGGKKRTWMKVASIAAVLVLCVGVGSTALMNMKKEGAYKPSMVEEAGGTPSGDYSGSDAAPMEPAPSEGSTAPSFDAAEKEADTHMSAMAPGDDAGSETVTNSSLKEETVEGEVEHGEDYDGVETDEPVLIDEPYPEEEIQGEAFVLTAGQWNDNANWPFFTNLVNAGYINFPSFGIDPRTRFKVMVTDEAGNPLANETVTLRTGGAGTLWTAKTNKSGVAYLFVPYDSSEVPAYVECNGEMAMLEVAVVDYDGDDQQGEPPVAVPTDEVTIVTSKAGENQSGIQVMFIVDTTGSMGDELAYLQMDFAQIAADTMGEGVTYSVNFYRDEGDAYVTKTNGFTSDVATVQGLLLDEYARGGGDTPEAVADILAETITNNGQWREDTNKVCFLIFDAPPHYGTESTIVKAVESAAARGIHVVPVVASNADRETELFGRALAICTDGEYVFLTDDSGVGLSHLEPIIGDYEVELLHDVIVRIINNYK